MKTLREHIEATLPKIWELGNDSQGSFSWLDISKELAGLYSLALFSDRDMQLCDDIDFLRSICLELHGYE